MKAGAYKTFLRSPNIHLIGSYAISLSFSLPLKCLFAFPFYMGPWQCSVNPHYPTEVPFTNSKQLFQSLSSLPYLHIWNYYLLLYISFLSFHNTPCADFWAISFCQHSYLPWLFDLSHIPHIGMPCICKNFLYVL